MLDDENLIKKIDPTHVLESITFFPQQCQQAWQEANQIKFPTTYHQVTNVVICGMGGSRFTPKAIKDLFIDRLTLPVEIIEDYHLPKYVSSDTLVILSSYSGTTEEPLNCLVEAIALGCQITAVTKGGSLATELDKHQIPFYHFKDSLNPSGQPRVGSGYMLFGHLGILNVLNIIKVDASEITTAITYAQKFSSKLLLSVSEIDNPAKQMAKTLKDRHVIIIGSQHLKGFVNGFANQLNETAKLMSDFRYIPELNHHLMEGLSHPNTFKQSALFVFFESQLYDAQIQKRYQITKEVVAKQGIKTTEYHLQAPTKLAQLLEGFTLSGFTTMYLAVLYQCDPAQIPWVDYFKSKLSLT